AQGLKTQSELAAEFPLSSLDPGVLERLAAGAPAAPLGWALLGEQGGAGAVRRLELAVHQSESAFAAMQVLAGLPGTDAHAALQRLLASGTALPLSVRAAASRVARWHENFPDLEPRIAALRTSPAPGDRAAGAWAASLASSSAARALLASEDLVQREAAANNGLWFDDGVIADAAALLGRAAPGRARSAFAFALSRPSGRLAVSSVCLRDLVLEGGSAAPLALRALASRDEPQFVAFAEAFAQHADPVLRAHLARGLGESDRPGAFGLLVRSYEFETDPSVRQAIVRALSGHAGGSVQRTLELAARLDPDPGVRSAARLALAGTALSDPPSGRDFSWIRVAVLRAEQEPAHAAVPPSFLRVLPGLALPIFADPAGVVVVGGVAPESFAMQHPSF
ncbi:MAG TPA: HEAT repeat domain-containing protein, partial [Polyangiaceae bacterium]|nr:HEAT repeat domain-containing protein [Polyangiaceae bacterium]